MPAAVSWAALTWPVPRQKDSKNADHHPVVDSREPEDGVVRPLVASKQATVAQLSLSNFHYLDEQEHVKLIIERKAISDLAASIVDGRYRDQRRRLVEGSCFFASLLRNQQYTHSFWLRKITQQRMLVYQHER